MNMGELLGFNLNMDELLGFDLHLCMGELFVF